MQSGNSLLPASLGPVWRRESRDLNLRLENLHTAGRAFEWTRESDRVSTLRSLEEPFLTDSLETMYLSPGTSFEVGQRWHSESFEIEATALDADGGLRTLRLRFNGSIDAADLRFLVERDGRLVAIEPPAVGESKIVERSRSTLGLP
jgi:hypothetical protein